jgi:hypothetical protein
MSCNEEISGSTDWWNNNRFYSDSDLYSKSNNIEYPATQIVLAVTTIFLVLVTASGFLLMREKHIMLNWIKKFLIA